MPRHRVRRRFVTFYTNDTDNSIVPCAFDSMDALENWRRRILRLRSLFRHIGPVEDTSDARAVMAWLQIWDVLTDHYGEGLIPADIASRKQTAVDWMLEWTEDREEEAEDAGVAPAA